MYVIHYLLSGFFTPVFKINALLRINMRTYLSIPYAEKEEAKRFGARWDPDKKLWYSPDGRNELIERWPLNEVEPIKTLIGEDRGFGGNTLFVDLVPTSCWFTNVRKCIHFTDWDRLRRFIYERANFQCECCQAKTPLDAHERWHFDEKRKIQKLMRIIALCKPCHEATHMGLAQIKGRGDIATQHLIKVSGMNQLEAINHIEQSFGLWRKRNLFTWNLDLTLITDSGIKLAQEFNAGERKNFAENETIDTRDRERNLNYNSNENNTITINEISIDEIKDPIKNGTTLEAHHPQRVTIYSQRTDTENTIPILDDSLKNITYKKNDSIVRKIKNFIKKFIHNNG